MAEAPGTESPNKAPTTGSSTGSKSGPVKPPVLEGTARPAGASAEKAGAAPSAKKPEPPKPPLPPEPPKPKSDGVSPSAPAAAPSTPAWVAGVVGGVIGLGAAYGLAALGYWPQQTAPQAAPDTRIAQFATAVPELQTVTSTVQDELAKLTSRVAGLENQPAPTPVEAPANTEFTEQLAALAARVDALGTSDAPAAVSAEVVQNLESQIQQLTSASATTASELEEAKAQLSSIATAAAADTGRSDKLALALSGLDQAFANGRPFGAELAVVRQEMAGVDVPAAVSSAAEQGLPRPAALALQLQAVLPDMLAGQPLPENATWQESAASWFRGVIALRPSAEALGNSPEAIVARLEAATQRGDFETANLEFSKLPPSMQAVGEEFGAALAAVTQANAFLVDVRTKALSAERAQ